MRTPADDRQRLATPEDSAAAEARYADLRDYVGFGVDDADCLAELLPHLDPHLPVVADHFYEAIQRNATASAVLKGPEQTRRLHASLVRWLQGLLSGPHDGSRFAYAEHIGRVHVRVGLPERYVFTAMNLVRRELCDLAREHCDKGANVASDAIEKVCDLELCVMTMAYHEAHEVRQARELQQLTFERLRATVVCVDAAGRVVAATRLARRGRDIDHDRPHYTELLGEHLVEAAQLETYVARCQETGGVVSLPRVEISDPEPRHLRVHIIPLDHTLARLVIHVEDLTDVVAAETRAAQAETLARLGGMSAQLAHEIRNPLAAISATLQVIVAGMDAEDRRAAILGKVQDQVHKLDRLVQDLLSYARVPELHVAVEDLAALARAGLQQSSVDARLIVRDDATTTVRADGMATTQIFVNLLQNARDATDEAAPVAIVLGPGPAAWVLDGGPGVPKDKEDSLFEAFVTTKIRGTGLGLSICRRLALAMQAQIDHAPDSAPWPDDWGQRGAAFRLLLPVAR